ncbi:MAG: hypothetical protein ABRQ26_10540 [Syntrophomonadaceae bacterium]
MGKNPQEGYILVFVMILFVIMAVVCSATLNIAFLERKQSQYDADLKQAEQAAEAGVAWTQEAIYTCLVAHCLEEELPQTVVAASGRVPLGPNGSASYELEEPGATLEDEEENSCVYKFICQGKGMRSQYRTVIKCEFNYINRYEIDHYGKKVFKGRNFENSGEVVSFQVVY